MSVFGLIVLGGTFDQKDKNKIKQVVSLKKTDSGMTKTTAATSDEVEGNMGGQKQSQRQGNDGFLVDFELLVLFTFFLYIFP